MACVPGASSLERSPAELGQVRLVGTSLQQFLGVVLELVAAAGLPATDGSAWLPAGRRQCVRAVSSGRARVLDTVQEMAGEGPSWTAANAHAVTRVTDPGGWSRWPRLGALPGWRDVGSVVAVPLGGPPARSGALTLYAAEQGAFGPDTARALLAVSVAATVPLSNLQAHLALVRETDSLRAALDSRAGIDLARGILMVQSTCTQVEALAQLVAASQRSNRKLRDVAADVVAAVSNRAVPGPPGRRVVPVQSELPETDDTASVTPEAGSAIMTP